MFKDSDFDDIDDLVDEGMVFVQEKDVETQGNIGTDDTEVVKGSGDKKVLDTEKAVNTVSEGISTANVPETISTTTPRTPPITTTVFDDEDVTMAMDQTLVKMKEEKAKEKRVVIKDVEDSSRLVRSITTLQPLLTIDPKDKGKGILQETKSMEKTKKKVQGDAQTERDTKVALRLQAELDEEVRVERERQEQASMAALYEEYDTIQASIDADALFAARLQQEEREQFTIEERAQFLVETIAAQRKFRATQRAAEIRSKPPTKTQLRNMLITYLKNMEEKKLVEPESEGKKGKRIKRVTDSTLKHKSSKKQKMMQEQESAKSDEDAATNYEQEKEELRMWLTVFLDEEETVDLEILFAKLNGFAQIGEEKSSLIADGWYFDLLQHVSREKGEGLTILVESHHTPTSVPSTLQPQTLPPSMQTTHVEEEAAPIPYESPLPRFHSLRSDEGSITLNELMVLCTSLSKKVESLESDLKQTKQTYGAAYTKLIMKVKKLEHKVKSSKVRRKVRLVISDDEDDLEDPSKQGRKIA
ncbi:hypothetical protein Tco_0103661 [Tanacetum coccineum]